MTFVFGHVLLSEFAAHSPSSNRLNLNRSALAMWSGLLLRARGAARCHCVGAHARVASGSAREACSTALWCCSNGPSSAALPWPLAAAAAALQRRPLATSVHPSSSQGPEDFDLISPELGVAALTAGTARAWPGSRQASVGERTRFLLPRCDARCCCVPRYRYRCAQRHPLFFCVCRLNDAGFVVNNVQMEGAVMLSGGPHAGLLAVACTCVSGGRARAG